MELQSTHEYILRTVQMMAFVPYVPTLHTVHAQYTREVRI